MLVEGPSSLEDRWCSIFGELGEPEALLALTFTFHADFFAELLARFAEAACEGGAAAGRSFAHLHVDVVCDPFRYRGHHLGFNVSLWPNAARLFHPKLLIALFKDEVVWSDGSLNLTPAGWRRNREVAMLHRPRSRSLPHQLRELLAALPGIAAAGGILRGTRDQPAIDLPGTFLTSLAAPIGPRFVSAAPKHADEVHLVAPFFEKAESTEPAMDDHWLRLLAQRYPGASFHVYLPQLEAQPLRVQGQRAMFEQLETQLQHRLSLHPVPPAPGPLHGKVACVVHTPNRLQRAHLLVGSPNMTRAALTASASRGNIESAWILDENWSGARRLFRGLASKACTIDDVEFEEPRLTQIDAWMPLRRASYDPLSRTLRIEWKAPAAASRTELRYAGHPVSLDRDACHGFDLIDGVSWIVTNKRGGGAQGCCPIEVPVELLPACESGVQERSPDDWLKLLGAVSSNAAGTGAREAIKHGDSQLDPARGFEWSERVRDLTARMRYFDTALTDPALPAVEREWLHNLFGHIYDSHDPQGAEHSPERVWRLWVRLELWQAAERLAIGAATKTNRALWRENASGMRRHFGLSRLPPSLRSQMRATIKALRRLR